MLRYLSLFCSIVFLFFASCEDKEKSRNNAVKDSVSTGITAKDTVVNKKQENKKLENNTETAPDNIYPLKQEELIPFLTEYGKNNPENRIRIVTRFGNIEVQLYHDTPLHRANFIMLTKEGYFGGTFFHRVAKGFVVQGGNSDNLQTSRKRTSFGTYLVPSEFEAGHRHSRGAFSAAKYAEQNVSKASSPYEFFIVQSDRGAHHLDNDHTVFGRVTSGMDVVDEIAKQEVGEGEWPHANIDLEVEIID